MAGWRWSPSFPAVEPLDAAAVTRLAALMPPLSSLR